MKEFIKYDDPAKLLYEDTDLSRQYIETILKELVQKPKYGVSVVIRILKGATVCNKKTQKLVLKCMEELAPKYNFYVFKLFPDEWLNFDFNEFDTLKQMSMSSIETLNFMGMNVDADTYKDNKLYLFDNNRRDRYNLLMGLPCRDFTLKYLYNIAGTKYSKLIEDEPL